MTMKGLRAFMLGGRAMFSGIGKV